MIDGFLLALTPALLLMTLAGVCLGIIWGALPGLSTTMAMGLLIGLSAGMSQDVAISFMLGVYTGSVFGGAISAVGGGAAAEPARARREFTWSTSACASNGFVMCPSAPAVCARISRSA